MDAFPRRFFRGIGYLGAAFTGIVVGDGGIFGGDSTVYRTRRGVEKTLFNVTIGLAVTFFVISIISVLVV